MKEILKNFLEKIKKINLPDFQIIRIKLLSKVDQTLAGFKSKSLKNSKNDSDKPKKARKKTGRFSKYFNKYNAFFLFIFLVCIGIFVFFGSLSKNFLDSNKSEKEAINRILGLHLKFATDKIVQKINHKKIKKRNLRQFIKDLNLFDEKIGYYRVNPCNSHDLSFGESAKPGNVIIQAPDFHTITISAYDCDLKEAISNTITLNEKEFSLQDELDFIRSQEERKSKIEKLRKKLKKLAHEREAHKKKLLEKNNTDPKKHVQNQINPIEELNNKELDHSKTHSENDESHSSSEKHPTVEKHPTSEEQHH